MKRIQYKKPALTYHQQVEKLKARGLKINNEKKAIHLLEMLSYYRLSGYWYPLLSDKVKEVFRVDSCFETAFNFYKFDRELRMLVSRELEKIEIAIRSMIIYSFSHQFGPKWYFDELNFLNKQKLKETRRRIKKVFQKSDEEFVVSFRRRYSDSLPPSWIMLEVTSFGVLSSLFNNFRHGRDKRKIPESFGLSSKVFASWLHCLVYIRNLCAHHCRLWNRTFSISPITPKGTQKQWLINRPLKSNKTYFVLSMIIYLINIIDPKNSFTKSVRELVKRYPEVKTNHMGFPENWQDEPIWQNRTKEKNE